MNSLSDSGAVTRTGSYGAVQSERPSPPPPPLHNTPEWFAWVTKRVSAAERDLFDLRTTLTHVQEQMGRPPIPAAKDPGAGMWLVLADVRSDCTAILAKLDAADKGASAREGWASRIGWRVLELLIAAGVGWLLLYVSGHWR